MLFSISDIDNLHSTLERWFDSWEELASIFNLFFSIRYKPDMYLQNKFINLVQAAESYHRRKYNRRTDKQNLPDDEYEKKRLAVLDCLDNLTNEEYKKWAKDKFQNDGLTLKQRLIDLTKLIPDITNQLINDEDQELFCAEIAATRNDFVHDKKTKNKKSAKSEELPDLIESLSFILQACFLAKELGFTSEQCNQLLNRNPRCQYTLERYQYTLERVRKKKYFDCPKENL
ncbi:MAG: hypothetical protein F6K39_09625 [Okeania sp. SIO3B3]|nr:hypothetical protein [Okeania sp. SIO3B3]